MVVEEKPVPTRFWLFADCVNTLLRMKLLDLLSIVFTLRMMSPSAEGGRRLARFHAWYDSEMAGNRLRVASICLQLTTHAVSISSSLRADLAALSPFAQLAQLGQFSCMPRLRGADLREVLASGVERIVGLWH